MDRFAPAFPLKHMHKDLQLMVRTAEELGVTLPATGVIHQLFTTARDCGLADQDFSAIYRLLAEMAEIGNEA
jgi:3-hydroxyisobutyrate dehydrogenase-like beta-hydroxyacid dehydrogenase